ncbi:PAS domain-containing sensor histidine kinase [Rubrolithibacter danxiaensis]|uniref:PAS domain-containing sensor histidine kinase n=1 Tax=Rubrolithibacter danxiaensis TaxID=3390805 RepID=UPI003BF77D24
MNSYPASLSYTQFLSVLSSIPGAFAIHVAEEAVIDFANDSMLRIWGKDKSVFGKSLEEALPELKGQPFIGMFARVWREGITLSGKDTPAQLEINGDLQTFYFDFEYRAVKDENGKTYCILHTATDVTERVLSASREQSLTEELTVTNEELSAANEALNATNEELFESQINLQQLYKELAQSDARFRSMVRQAPVGMCIINANGLMIQDVNDAYLELVGKPREQFENRSIWDAVAEAADVYAPVLDRVIQTGMPFVAKEHEVMLIKNGVPETVFLDFVYEPMKQDEKVTAIMVLVIDVSDKVINRRHIEDMEERARLAVEAADIGTFDADLVKQEIQTSDRFNSILGFGRQLEWKELVSIIHREDRPKRETALKEALKNGRLFYEVRFHFPDHSIHWMRVQGKVYYNQDKQPVRMLGTLLDITQFKHLEQQKDDFISIASHELKTPITSLKASLQLLERVSGGTSEMMTKLIDQSNRSMKKISGLVDDLLNVSRNNQKQPILNKTRFTMDDIIKSCRIHIKAAGNYELTVEGDEHLELHADERAVEQVIVNLINNAIKYAPESLEIILRIKNESNFAVISIQDKGPGVPADKIPLLFDRYYQAQPSGFNNSGLGLGLYISSDIVKRHGGKIGVDSEVGKGSTFWFTLPLTD